MSVSMSPFTHEPGFGRNNSRCVGFGEPLLRCQFIGGGKNLQWPADVKELNVRESKQQYGSRFG
jgi:hypothetical protein